MKSYTITISVLPNGFVVTYPDIVERDAVPYQGNPFFISKQDSSLIPIAPEAPPTEKIKTVEMRSEIVLTVDGIVEIINRVKSTIA